VAIWFAQNVYLFGSSAEIADRVLEIARAGAGELLRTDGDSFSLPTELIERLGEDVIPRIRALARADNSVRSWH
jgi:hypothetical protein